MSLISSASRYAIANLRTINANLAETQNRISTGLKVASAKDNAYLWRTASTIRTDLNTYEAVTTSLSTAKAAVDTAALAAEEIGSALSQIQTKIGAYQSTTDATAKTQIMVEVAALQARITNALTVSTGTNLLDNTTAYNYSQSVAADGTVTLSSLTPTDLKTLVSNTAISAATPAITTFLTTFTASDIDLTGGAAAITSDLTAAVTAASNYSAKLGSLSKQIDSQVAFTKSLAGVKESALSTLVDADMEEESAKLQALQVKQQLAYQALSISNASSQNILRLFQ
ncbi:MAG: hypothetical protein EOP18_11170 [Rhizobiaceae bacterium]|nr:MAG: hypothetical protein EOP18_11170 [Rhizobiaceae bacterium]